MVVKDSPDEKKQPRLEIRDAKNKVLKTYQMPVRANLMVRHEDWKKKRGAAPSPGREEHCV